MNFLRYFKFFFKKEYLYCFFSAALLILAYPKNNFWVLAWIAFVPLLIALSDKTAKQSFWLGYITGLVFFTGMLYWFIFVTALGMMLLVMFLSIYFGLFGLSCFWAYKKRSVFWIFFLAACWVALEFVRSHFLTGFGWVLLGHSQERNLWAIQIADITGVYGISFVVMMVNVVFAQMILMWREKRVVVFKSHPWVFLSAAAIFTLTLAYGFYRLHEPLDFVKPSVRLGAIQASIPNERRQDREQWLGILKEHIDLAFLASKERPDLIIWPESSFPGYYWQRPDLFGYLTESIEQIRTPSLVGLIAKEDENYFNAAFLFSEKGEIKSRYDKINLVPFGEYIPFRRVFPFLSLVVPIDDFTPGEEYVLFPIRKHDQDIFFGVLICFEDTLPHVARELSLRGADLLVNITNDDWFRDTKAPFLHRQAALFRAVENRKPLVRSANTGVSSFIDSRGRVFSTIANAQGKETYIQGFLTQKMYVIDQNTVYTKFGDVFAYLCFGGILIDTAGIFIKRKKKKKKKI